MEIKTDDLYADMINDPFWYDFGDYPVNAQCFENLKLTEETIERLCATNRKAYGKMKDETNSMPLTLYTCLKCKSYGIEIKGECSKCEIKTLELTTKKKNKGICRHLTQRDFVFQDFLEQLNMTRKPWLPNR